tara:strand:- start:1548 stop:1808 length:261 start_codon:yes stop_codon:yes gene_type:complete
MNINELIAIIKKKLYNNFDIKEIFIEDKSYLHKNHPGNVEGKFHLKITLTSLELKKMSKLESNKKVYKVLSNELKNFIHSIQLLIT